MEGVIRCFQPEQEIIFVKIDIVFIRNASVIVGSGRRNSWILIVIVIQIVVNTDKQITELLLQLDQCENPSNCPHGRPTWVRWTVSDLEKQFKRIV